LNQPDDFDRFTMDRNRREDALPPPRHVHPQMEGGEDLDAYGTWRDVPEYGEVWVPPVQAGWAPYRTGHWAWVAPWGWTWIDDAPWGFAPFHYGRWAMAGGGWVWIPGARAVRPVYAPALVAFVGGPHFSIGIGIGGGGIGAVAWFPLGPQEVFRPAYAVSPGYVRNVNVTNVTNVTNITNVNVTNVRYVNQNVAGAATAVPQNAFTAGRPVGAAAVAVTPQQMANAQISHTAMVPPQRESVVGGARGGVAAPPASMMSRQVVAKAPPPPAPVSFQSQQAALAQNGGRPLAPTQVQQIRSQAPPTAGARPAVRSAQTVSPAQPQRPANRFDSRPPNATQPVGNPAGSLPARNGNGQAIGQQPAVRPAASPAPVEQPAARPAPAARSGQPARVERPAARPTPPPEQPAARPEARPEARPAPQQQQRRPPEKKAERGKKEEEHH
jgi:hypothetical protein